MLPRKRGNSLPSLPVLQREGSPKKKEVGLPRAVFIPLPDLKAAKRQSGSKVQTFARKPEPARNIVSTMEEAKRKRNYAVTKLEVVITESLKDLSKQPVPSKRQFSNHVTKLEKELENVDNCEEALLTISDADDLKVLAEPKSYEKLGWKDNPISLFELSHRLLNELAEKETELTDSDKLKRQRGYVQELFSNIDVKKDLLTRTVNHVKNLVSKEESPGISRWMDKLDEQFKEVQTMVLKVIKSREDLQTLEGHTKEEWTTLLDTLVQEQTEIIDQCLKIMPRGGSDVLDTSASSASSSNKLKLKKLDYPTFHGSYKTYAKWRREYDTLVVPENSDESSRATILRTNI